jgi:hypothetical protein|tara:strand:+ start:719 stop:961 length:243 start_codon:yes stop_codon:yes gene_type:complete
MKNTSLDKIVQLENFIQSYGHEFQSISNEIKIYLLDDSEIHIIVSDSIEIYTYYISGADNKYSSKDIEGAKTILKQFLIF